MRAPRPARALRPGSTVGIVAPAGPMEPQALEEGLRWLDELGFRVKHRDDLTARDGFLAGGDDRRAAEIDEMLDDPEVDALLCARGGYGCHRIMSRLDPRRFERARKPFFGYSDATTLLLWQLRYAGLMGFHGPMLERGDKLTQESRDGLAAALLGEALPPLEGERLVGGRAEGRLIGGSLSLLAASLGSPWEVDARGAILMLEDVGEQPYRIDRMLQQLRAAGKLEGIVGVGVGQLTACEGTRYPRPTAEEVVAENFEPLGVPVVTNLPFGHCDRHLPWPVGARAVLDADRSRIELLESAAA